MFEHAVPELLQKLTDPANRYIGVGVSRCLWTGHFHKCP